MGKTKTIPAKTIKIKPDQKSADFSVWYPVILILLIFLLYGRTISFHYVKMDDMDLIVDNEPFIKHTKNIPQAFRQSCFEIPGHLTVSKSYYRPMLIVSFMLDYRLHGARPSVFHFMNILYHIFACLLLYGFIRKLSGNSFSAFALALLFAIIPAWTV
jgi:protein O-mannosyl-transferase